MGARYQSKSASGYNSSPPADDGSQNASNLITWAKHKTKLADPIKTLADDINTALVAASDYSVRQITASDSLVAGDHMRCVEIPPTVSSVAITVTLPDAATMSNVYRVYVKNSSPQAAVTVTRATGGDTIDGVAGNVTIPKQMGMLFQTTAAANGYLSLLEPGRFKIGSLTRDLTAVSGSVAYTGVGFKPRAIVLFNAGSGSTDGSWGFDDGTSRAMIAQTGGASMFSDSTACVWCYQGAATRQNGLVASFDADGFTVTWTKTGSPTGTANVVYLALR